MCRVISDSCQVKATGTLTTKVGTAIASHCLALRIKASAIHIVIIITEAIKPGLQLNVKPASTACEVLVMERAEEVY